MRKIYIFGGMVCALLLWLWFNPADLFEAPQLTVKTLNGRSLELQSLRGRPFLVTFWSTDCPSCIKEIPDLIDLYNAFSPQGFEIIGIAMSYSPPDHVIQTVKNKRIVYPVALDIAGDAARAFGDVSLTPSHFLISPDGVIVQYRIGMLDFEALRKALKDMLLGVT